jgi:hypothetical protein
LYSTTVKACSLRSCGGPVFQQLVSVAASSRATQHRDTRQESTTQRTPRSPLPGSAAPRVQSSVDDCRLDAETDEPINCGKDAPPVRPPARELLVCHPSRPALARAEVWGSVLARPVQALRYGGSTRVMAVQLGSEVIWAGSQSLRRAGTELPGTSGRMQLSLPARGTPRCGRNRLVLARCSLGLTVIAVSPRQMPGLTMRPGRRGAVIRRESCPGPSLSC